MTRVLVLAACLVASSVHADDLVVSDRFVVIPYIWALNVDAELGLGPLSLPINLATDELLSDVEYGALGYVRWNLGDYFLFTEGIVVSFDSDAFAPVFNQAVLADFGLVEVGGGRHFVLRNGPAPFDELVVSPHIAVLHGNLDVQVSGQLNTNIEQKWTGVAVGAMLNGPITERLTYTLRAQYSDFSSELEDYFTSLAAVSYHLNDHYAIGVGYRFMHGDYAKDGVVINADFDGAVVGLQFSW